jgi:hypothetical protein
MNAPRVDAKARIRWRQQEKMHGRKRRALVRIRAVIAFRCAAHGPIASLVNPHRHRDTAVLL